MDRQMAAASTRFPQALGFEHSPVDYSLESGAFLSLCVCVFVVCLSVCLCVCLFLSVSPYSSVYLSVGPSVYL